MADDNAVRQIDDNADERDPTVRVGTIDAGDPKLAEYAQVIEENPELLDIATRTSRRRSSRVS